MIQFSQFATGGYVLHKVATGGRKYSAWFDAAGNLLDAERTDAPGRTVSVAARHTVIRARLAQIGRRYRGR
jgi:hypothetical protein